MIFIIRFVSRPFFMMAVIEIVFMHRVKLLLVTWHVATGHRRRCIVT
jgi:hypothetical protein